MSVRGIYSMLESLNPCFLKRDITRYKKPIGLYTEALGNFPDTQLLGLKMAQLQVLPQSQQRILKNAKRPTRHDGEEAQLVSNFSSYATPEAKRSVQTLGKILNPNEVYEFPPVVNLGKGSRIKDRRTWRKHGCLISEMSDKSLTPQQDKSRQYNLPNAPKFEEGKRISLKSTSSVKQEIYGNFTGLLVTIWGSIRTESPTYSNVEMSPIASKPDPSGILLKTHSQRYCEFVPPSTNRQTYYCVGRFFDFLKSRNEPIIG